MCHKELHITESTWDIIRNPCPRYMVPVWYNDYISRYKYCHYKHTMSSNHLISKIGIPTLVKWHFTGRCQWEYYTLCLLVFLGGPFSYMIATLHPWPRLRRASTLARKPLCEPALAYCHVGTKFSDLWIKIHFYSQICILNVACKISAILFVRDDIINHSSAALVYMHDLTWSSLYLQMS